MGQGHYQAAVYDGPEPFYAERLRGQPARPVRGRACHHCPVALGLWGDRFADPAADPVERFAHLPGAVREAVARTWWCHHAPGSACRGAFDRLTEGTDARP